MSETPPDFQALARRYLDLWQAQVAAVAADPALAETVARGVAIMTQSAAAMAQATGLSRGSSATSKADRQANEQTGPEAKPTDPGHSTDTDRAEAFAVASDDSRLDPAQLSRRVAALEQRVADLEAALGGGSSQAPRQPRSGRS